MIGVLLLVVMVLFATTIAVGLWLAVWVSDGGWNAWLVAALVWGLCLFAWVPAFTIAGYLIFKSFGFVPTPAVTDYFRPDLGVSATILPSICVGYMLSRGTGRWSVLWVSAAMGIVAAVLLTKTYVITSGIVWEAIVLGWLAIWAFEARATNRGKRGECPRCRYDLTGLPDRANCPECGHERTVLNT